MERMFVNYTDECYDKLLKFSKDIHIIDIIYNQTIDNPYGIEAKIPVLSIEEYSVLLRRGDVLVKKGKRVFIEKV